MEKGICCICGEPLDPDGLYERICVECKVNLQVVRTKDDLVVTR